jgi:epoxyqueuosine reductase
MPDLLDTRSAIVRAEALRLGFMACGIAKAERLDDDARRLEQWLKAGRHADMAWMETHFDLRVDPTKLVPGAKSVVTVLMNYFPAEQQDTEAPKIARYAWGRDYHEVIRAKLNELLHHIRTEIGEVDGRGFVDSAPVLERSWALRSGLGWIGKNANLLQRDVGSYFFIATLITDLELRPDPPFATDHCGTCTRCIDACPTGAIEEAAVINSNKCISYLTIELKDALLPAGMDQQLNGWIFGCDVCQEVCPWNRFSKPTTEPAFKPLPEILNLRLGEWEAMGEERFKQAFRHSPLKRSKWKGIMRNVKAIRNSSSGDSFDANS